MPDENLLYSNSGAANLELLRPTLADLGRAPTPADIAAAMRIHGLAVSDQTVLATVEQLRKESVGAGPLQDLLELPGVTDVVVNGPGECYIDRGRGLEKVAVDLPDEASVRAVAVRLASIVGRRLDDAHPWVDGRLPDGTRLHAVLGPIASPGTCISLRVPSRCKLKLSDWFSDGQILHIMHAIVQAKLAFLISGGTGSGKTTLLGSLLAEIGARERLLVIEDSKELLPDHRHCVWLEGRPANADGAGAVDLTNLVKQALRMRPDRVVLGEVRGAEVVDLLIALNTGHEGGCGTIHANSAMDVPARLEALAGLAGMGPEALAAQAVSALDLVVHVGKGSQGIRNVQQICVLVSQNRQLLALPALTFGNNGVQYGPGWQQLNHKIALRLGAEWMQRRRAA